MKELTELKEALAKFRSTSIWSQCDEPKELVDAAQALVERLESASLGKVEFDARVMITETGMSCEMVMPFHVEEKPPKRIGDLFEQRGTLYFILDEVKGE